LLCVDFIYFKSKCNILFMARRVEKMSTPLQNSSSSNSKISSNFISKNVQQVDYVPLWAYVTLLNKGVEGGGTRDGLAIFVKKLLKVLILE